MTYAITQTCCNDATCVSVCPVNCIHPTPEEPDFGRTEMLYIDPKSCIDCGACADACPVEAVFPVDSLPAAQARYGPINAEYFAGREPGQDPEGPNFHVWGNPPSSAACPRTSHRSGSRWWARDRRECTPPRTCCCTPRPR